ncbi:MAG: triose-phosphate isomerase [Deltaproteobacteria bacterium]|jgi:triosephosphate isomerase|nr:triose-phosphate isomerase [Deltaproteobacteria bacterium]
MRKLLAANWKMYKTIAETVSTLMDLKKFLPVLPEDREVAIFAPFTVLPAAASVMQGRDRFTLGGQDVYPAREGAFTGEVSPLMLLDSGCGLVLTGHSERRHILGESAAFVGRKTAFALESGLDVVLCIGETLDEREKGKLESVLGTQLEEGTKDVAADVTASRLSIAYEPVWAIGTGKVAGEADILQTHALVRKILRDIFGAKAAEMRILYGGSVKADNAGEILKLDNVDGVLVGGASLQAETFSRIVLA